MRPTDAEGDMVNSFGANSLLISTATELSCINPKIEPPPTFARPT